MVEGIDDTLKALEGVLSAHLGPIGSITLMTQLKHLGLTREQLSHEDLDILVEQIGEAVTELIGDVKGRSILEKMNSVLENGDT